MIKFCRGLSHRNGCFASTEPTLNTRIWLFYFEIAILSIKFDSHFFSFLSSWKMNSLSLLLFFFGSFCVCVRCCMVRFYRLSLFDFARISTYFYLFLFLVFCFRWYTASCILNPFFSFSPSSSFSVWRTTHKINPPILCAHIQKCAHKKSYNNNTS